MPKGCADGLGFEEAGAVSTPENFYTTGSVKAAGIESTASVKSTGSVYASTNMKANTGSIVAGTSMHVGTSTYIPAGSETGIIQPYAAASVISGGDIVTMSGGEATVAGALATSAYGVGVDAAPVASGGTANILVHGVYDFGMADAVNAGSYAMVGSTANTVMQADTFEKALGKCISGGASGGTALVLF